MSKSRLEFSQNAALKHRHLLPNELKCRTGTAGTMKSLAVPRLWERTTGRAFHRLLLIFQVHRKQGDCVQGLLHTKLNICQGAFKRSLKGERFPSCQQSQVLLSCSGVFFLPLPGQSHKRTLAPCSRGARRQGCQMCSSGSANAAHSLPGRFCASCTYCGKSRHAARGSQLQAALSTEINTHFQTALCSFPSRG